MNSATKLRKDLTKELLKLTYYKIVGPVWNVEIETFLRLCEFALTKGWEMPKIPTFPKDPKHPTETLPFPRPITRENFLAHYRESMNSFHFTDLVICNALPIVDKIANVGRFSKSDSRKRGILQKLKLNSPQDARKFLIQWEPRKYMQELWFYGLYSDYLSKACDVYLKYGTLTPEGEPNQKCNKEEKARRMARNELSSMLFDIHPLHLDRARGETLADHDLAYFSQLAKTAVKIIKTFYRTEQKKIEDIINPLRTCKSLHCGLAFTDMKSVVKSKPNEVAANFVNSLREDSKSAFNQKITGDLPKTVKGLRLIQGIYKEYKDFLGHPLRFWPELSTPKET